MVGPTELLSDVTLQQLVSLVKSLQKILPQTKSSWAEFLTVRGKDGTDPARHDREVLESYLTGVLNDAADGSGAGGGGGEAGGGGSGSGPAASELVRSYLKWARHVNKDGARGRGVVPTAEEEESAASSSGSQQQVTAWSLVRRTRAHAKYGKYYGELPSYGPGWCRVKRRALSAAVRPRLLALDCEMCATEDDPAALLGVCVVDEFGQVVYRQLVRPPGKIRDLRTPLTGVTEADMAKVTLTFKEAQRAVRKLLEGGGGGGDYDGDDGGGGGGGGGGSGRPVVLVGHSLQHDLAALKIDHQPVIDTSLVFSFSGLPDCIPGLKDLAKLLLGLDMREERGGAHDSREDAGVAMRLVMRELQMARPTPPLEPPKIKVPPADLAKLCVHSLPEGASEAALRQLFADAGAPAVVRLEGDLAERKVLLVFAHLGAANEAFNKLPGNTGRDVMGRPYKEVPLGGPAQTCKVRKMAAGGGMMFGGAAKPNAYAGAKRARSGAAGSVEGADKAAAGGSDSVRKPKRQRRDGGGGGGGKGGGAGPGKEKDPLKEVGKARQQKGQQRVQQLAEANGKGGAAAPAAAAAPTAAPSGAEKGQDLDTGGSGPVAPSTSGGAEPAGAAAKAKGKEHKRKRQSAPASAGGADGAQAAGGTASAGRPEAAPAQAAEAAAGEPASPAGGEASKPKKQKSERKRKRDRNEEGGKGDEEGEKGGKKKGKGGA